MGAPRIGGGLCLVGCTAQNSVVCRLVFEDPFFLHFVALAYPTCFDMDQNVGRGRGKGTCLPCPSCQPHPHPDLTLQTILKEQGFSNSQEQCRVCCLVQVTDTSQLACRPCSALRLSCHPRVLLGFPCHPRVLPGFPCHLRVLLGFPNRGNNLQSFILVLRRHFN